LKRAGPEASVPNEPISNRFICTFCGVPIEKWKEQWMNGDPYHEPCRIALIVKSQQFGVGGFENYDGSQIDE
jgi:hypothetical protein